MSSFTPAEVREFINGGDLSAAKDAVLQSLSGKTMEMDDASNLLDEISLARVTALTAGTFKMKVTEKGCLQFRGVPGVNVKFGLSLYVEAVEFLLDHQAEIKRYIGAQNGKLSRKRPIPTATPV